MNFRITKNYLSKNFLLIFLTFLAIVLFFVSNLNIYPKNPGEWFEIRYYVGGDLECLIPSSILSSSVDIDLIEHEVEIRQISITKLCNFDEGYIDLEITDLNGEPIISELNKTFYFVNKTGSDRFRIYLNSDLMKNGYLDGTYEFSIKSKISDKFYTIYEISSNTHPWAILFYYPISLLGYSCDECFSLLEGNLRQVHPDEKIYETGNIGDRQFFFENEDRVVIRFNPKDRFKVTLQEYLSNLLLALIAGILTFFILELHNKKI